jgi:hypothetical protein
MPESDAGGNLPLFLSHSQRERDEFVRALGVAENDELALLNLLCSHALRRRTARVHALDLLASVGAWARAHGRPDLLGGSAKGALRRLLVVLERNGYATTRDDWETILLRDGDRRAGSGERAIAAIAKAYRAMEEDPLHPFPGSDSIHAPATAIVSASYTDFTSELVSAHSESTKILRIVFSESLDLLVTPSILPRLLEVARGRLLYHIRANPNLTNHTLLELKKIPQFRYVMDHQRLFDCLEGRRETPPLFWVYVGHAVASARDEDLLEPKHKPGRMGLFQSAYLVHSYYKHRHKVETERKQREADQTAVVEWLARSGHGFTLEELTDIRDESGTPLKDKYPDARALVEELLEQLAANADAAGTVAPIVRFAELWMHRNAVLPMLHEEVKAASEYCRGTAEAEWKPKLEHGSVEDPAMADDDAFDAWLQAIVDTRCPRFAAMLRDARLVHLLITEEAARDPAAFRTHAALFEGLDNPAWKTPSRLLGLERLRIVGRIVSGLPLLRRFILRRRFRLRKPSSAAPSRGAQAGTGPLSEGAGSTPQHGPEEEGGGAVEGRIVTMKRPDRGKPDTFILERPSRRAKTPKTMDEAVVKLREAMSRRWR